MIYTFTGNVTINNLADSLFYPQLAAREAAIMNSLRSVGWGAVSVSLKNDALASIMTALYATPEITVKIEGAAGDDPLRIQNAIDGHLRSLGYVNINIRYVPEETMDEWLARLFNSSIFGFSTGAVIAVGVVAYLTLKR